MNNILNMTYCNLTEFEFIELYDAYLFEKYNIKNPVKNENGTYFSMALQQGFEIFKDACIVLENYRNKKASN